VTSFPLVVGPSAQLPPYFALLSRAVSILEGIALYGDADYSLVGAASPVAAQWLLISDSPASQQAVNELMETSGLDGLMKLANIAGMESTRTHARICVCPVDESPASCVPSLRPMRDSPTTRSHSAPQVACAVLGWTSQPSGESLRLGSLLLLGFRLGLGLGFHSRGAVRLPSWYIQD
jgi:hypothetical protein